MALTVRGVPVRGAADRLEDLNAISATSEAVRRRTPNRIQRMITTRLLRFDPTLGAGISAGRGRLSVYRGAERQILAGPIGRTA